MAGLVFHVNSPSTATGTAVKTHLQIVAPTNQRVKVREWSVSFDGVTSSNAPVLVEVLRQTTAGTNVANTPVKNNSADDETIQSTAADTFSSTEPTAGTILLRELVPQYQGGYTWTAPLFGELVVPGGTRMAIRMTAAATANATCRMTCEE